LLIQAERVALIYYNSGFDENLAADARSQSAFLIT
jgi:hypothetical protein